MPKVPLSATTGRKLESGMEEQIMTVTTGMTALIGAGCLVPLPFHLDDVGYKYSPNGELEPRR